MKRFLLLPILFCLVSCGDDDNSMLLGACGVENPIEDLDFLRLEVERRNDDTSEDAVFCFIEQAEIDGQTIFLYNDCNPRINKAVPIFDCSGASIGNLGDENFDSDAITNRTIIFSPPDFACQFD